MFDQGVQFARVLPGALFTILQVGAEPGEALVTVVGLLGTADVLPHPSPTPTSPFGPKQLLTRLSRESQQQTQQTGLQSSVPKANKCTHIPSPLPPSWAAEMERTGHSGNYRGPEASSTAHESRDLGHGEWVVSPLKLFQDPWALQMSAIYGSCEKQRFLETERGGMASYLEYFSPFVLLETSYCCIAQAGLELATFLSC